MEINNYVNAGISGSAASSETSEKNGRTAGRLPFESLLTELAAKAASAKQTGGAGNPASEAEPCPGAAPSDSALVVQNIPLPSNFHYPPSTAAKGIAALTPEQAADLNSRYDFSKLRPNSNKLQNLLYELTSLGVISESDFQSAVLGRPVSFDEKGQPIGWLNYLGSNKDGETETISDWFRRTSDHCQILFQELFLKGEGESDLAQLYQSKIEPYYRIAGILDVLFGLREN